MKKMISLLLVLVLIMGLTACGNGEVEVSEDNGVAVTESPEESDSATDSLEEPITLSITGWLECNQEGLQAVADLYTEANPNVEVEIELLETSQYDQVYMARMASGEGADIMATRTEAADKQNYAAGDYVADLSDLECRANFKAGMDEAGEYQGVIQGLPVQADLWGIWYNKDMLKELGLKYPETVGEFKNACEVAKAEGILPIANGLKDGWTVWMSVWTLWGKVGEDDPDFFNKAQVGEVKFSDNPNVEWGIQQMKDYYDAGYYIEDLLGTSQDSAQEMFFNGEALFCPSGSWFLSDMIAADLDFEYGFAKQPYNEEKQDDIYSQGGYGSTLSVYKKSENLETAKDFINFFFQPENYTAYCKAAGVTGPVLKGIAVEGGPAAQDIADCISSKGINLHPGTAQDVLFSGVQAVIAGQKTPAEVVTDMDDAIEKSLNK
jgi:raffinose/stachyose/melibiose transport system substrate-binding protein